MDDAAEGVIRWREWGRAAFDEAARKQKPILLDISAVWCHWCHVMDNVTYADPGVVARVNQDFVPVRVDTDRRPDVNNRYNMGGWPTTAFLTPEGEILTGATYLPPGDMKQVLGRVASFYEEHREENAGRVAAGGSLAGTAGSEAVEPEAVRSEAARPDASLAPVPPPARPRRALDPEPALGAAREVLGEVEEVYDPSYGGFGMAPKFPHVKVLELLLVSHLRTGEPRHLEMVEKTLQSMNEGGLCDHVWGGFFRYSTSRDWAIPHYEKMLEDNSELLALYSKVARLTGDRSLVEAALETARYLTGWLRSEQGYFYGSQDADEEYYKLGEEERRRREPPRVDRTLYVGWNALAARGFLEAYLATGDERLRETALVALEYVWGVARLGGDTPEKSLIAHYVDEAGPHGPALLEDAADLALALLDAYEATGERSFLERAAETAGMTRRAFEDPEGAGFFDTGEDGEPLGRLRVRYKGLEDNARLVLALLRLADLDEAGGEGGGGDAAELRELAGRTLAHFLGPHRRHGLLAAGYALALDRAAGPTPVVSVPGTPEESDLARAAAAAVSAAKAVRYGPVEAEPEGRRRERDHAGDRAPEPGVTPVATICVGTRCLPPVKEPSSLREAVREAARRRSTPGRAAGTPQLADGRWGAGTPPG